MKKVIAKIEDMHCEHCKHVVENAISKINGVKFANVVLKTMKLLSNLMKVKFSCQKSVTLLRTWATTSDFIGLLTYK